MKKLLISLSLMVLLAVAFAIAEEVKNTTDDTTVKGEKSSAVQEKTPVKKGPRYVDANKNKVCDHFEKGERQGRMHRHWNQNQGEKGPRFIDENNNNTCDHFEKGECQGRMHRHWNQGQGQGKGMKAGNQGRRCYGKRSYRHGYGKRGQGWEGGQGQPLRKRDGSGVGAAVDKDTNSEKSTKKPTEK